MLAKIGLWRYERRMKKQHLQEVLMTPGQESTILLKKVIVASLLGLFALKYSNARTERRLLLEYRNNYLLENDLKELVKREAEREKAAQKASEKSARLSGSGQ